MSETTSTTKEFLLWDGDCGLCEKCAAWITKNNTQKSIIIMPFQLADNPPMTPLLYEQCSRSIQFISANGDIEHGADALIRVLECTKYRWITPIMRHKFIKPIVELMYYFVAQNRKKISRILGLKASSGSSCTIVSRNHPYKND